MEIGWMANVRTRHTFEPSRENVDVTDRRGETIVRTMLKGTATADTTVCCSGISIRAFKSHQQGKAIKSGRSM